MAILIAFILAIINHFSQFYHNENSPLGHDDISQKTKVLSSSQILANILFPWMPHSLKTDF